MIVIDSDYLMIQKDNNDYYSFNRLWVLSL